MWGVATYFELTPNSTWIIICQFTIENFSFQHNHFSGDSQHFRSQTQDPFKHAFFLCITIFKGAFFFVTSRFCPFLQFRFCFHQYIREWRSLLSHFTAATVLLSPAYSITSSLYATYFFTFARSQIQNNNLIWNFENFHLYVR